MAPDPTSADRWLSIDAHHCQDDCYTAVLTVLPRGVRLEWTVAGPRKSNRIVYLYELL